MQKAQSFGGVTLVLATLALVLPILSSTVWAATRADIFTVSVPVDATAANANAARDAARLDGERRAYAALLDRLTLARDRTRLPAPSDTTLNQVILGFEVANERRSTVRYLADYSFHFRPEAVERLLRDRGVPFAETLSKPLIVLAVLEAGGQPRLWEDPNPWREAWAGATLPQVLVPMRLPLGEVEDVSAIDAAAADSGDDAHLQAISANYDHADVLVARATMRSGATAAVDVSATRFVPGSPGGEQTWVGSYTADQGESEAALLGRAVAGTIAQVEDAWKQQNMLNYSQAATLVVNVPTSDLGSWLSVRQRLAATASVQGVQLISLDRHAARVELRYVGSPDQLRVALAQNNLSLTGSDPDWVLQEGAPAAADREGPPPAAPSP